MAVVVVVVVVVVAGGARVRARRCGAPLSLSLS
jgi:hypothetical protein